MDSNLCLDDNKIFLKMDELGQDYVVLVYGITEHPMMLVTNKESKSKEVVIKIARITSPAEKSKNISTAKSRCSSL